MSRWEGSRRCGPADAGGDARAGAEVVAQASFFDRRWQGRADFLLRVERPSGLGGWGYEPADAKLSRIVKGAAVLQLCLYADQVPWLQGTAPEERIAVVTGDGPLHHYRLDDYDAYFRRVQRRFEERLLAAERVSTARSWWSIGGSAASGRRPSRPGELDRRF